VMRNDYRRYWDRATAAGHKIMISRPNLAFAHGHKLGADDLDVPVWQERRSLLVRRALFL
jgi:hypothetical protein